MDLYRYFHPHYNPRLRKVSVRLVELGELEQGAVELRKAIERMQVRTENAPVGEIRAEHFSELLVALDYVVETLSTLMKAHPGDDLVALFQLLDERKGAPGWENWVRLLRQRLEIICQYGDELLSTGARTGTDGKSNGHSLRA